MRNGLSMYPMCLPDVLQQNQFPEKRISFHEGSDLLNLGSTFPNTSSTPTHSLFTLAKQCNNLKQPSVTNMSKITNSKSSFGLESSNQAQQGPSEYNTFSEVNLLLKPIYTWICVSYQLNYMDVSVVGRNSAGRTWFANHWIWSHQKPTWVCSLFLNSFDCVIC